NDWFIVADQDEFQLYPESLNSIIDSCENNHKTFITGCLLDRISNNGVLLNVVKNKSIWKQFPLVGFVSFSISGANPYKITLMKGFEILSEGQHGIIKDNKNYPITNEVLCQVHHFKLTSSLKSKFKKRLFDFKKLKCGNCYLGYYEEIKKMLNYISYYKGINLYEPAFLIGYSLGNFKDYFFWIKILEITKNWEILHSYPSIDVNLLKKIITSKLKGINAINSIFDVSIIISSYNQSSSIVEIIKILRIEASNKKINTQILIADDGSNENECKKNIANIILFKNDKYTDINFIRQEDLGFRLASSRNNALKLAKSNNIIFIDGDCIPNYGIIENHLKAIQNKTISVGSREYRPNFSNKNNFNKYEKFYMKGRIESSTIKNKSKTKSSWRAVIGRNFAFKKNDKNFLFDENIYGWGFEDIDFGIQLFINGYSTIFNNLSSVIEYGDIKGENDPINNEKQDSIINIQINLLYLMNKYKNYNDIFIELSKFLSYYRDSFDFINGKFIFNNNSHNIVSKKFSEDKNILNIFEANNEFEEAKNNLKSFYRINKQNIDFYPHKKLLKL
ncbi:MAG TPA: glycosyltransferase, partial [Rickettsiales bacterium]|nr:glycosyltransferase [Rickettsiales bacterium]